MTMPATDRELSHDVRTVLVTGATGLHGGAVARALLANGYRVRAFTRQAASAASQALANSGANLAEGDLLDTASLVAAMQAVDAVYAVTTPFGAGTDAEIQQGETLIAAAVEAGVAWFVLASVASAGKAVTVPHFASKWRIERGLRESGLAHTVVAPSYFYENLGSPLDIAQAGELQLPLGPDRQLQQVAAADVGAVVGAVLKRKDEFLGERIEVAADQPTPQQMVDAISSAVGQPVLYQQADLAGRSGDIAEMYRFLDEIGYGVDIESLRDRFPEVQWQSFAAWAHQTVISLR
jgi:uncharacterized protein YbjT (DUF2867 family)